VNEAPQLSDCEEDVVTEEPYEEDTEDPYKSRITIDNINIVSEMNTSQMAAQQEEEQNSNIPTHGYNLRECLTRRSKQVSLTITDGNNSDKATEMETEQQYMTIHPKVHAHVMLTQMNVKQGLLTFGEKGNEAILKELKQLHDKRAITPLQGSDMMTEERRKALRYLMFLKEKRDGTIRHEVLLMDGHKGNILKRRSKFTDRVTRGYDVIMHNRCEGREVCNCDGYSRCIRTCRYGGSSTHASGGNYC